MIARRGFVSGAGGAAAGLTVSSFPKPAIAQALPEVRWRMPSSFPKSLDTLYGGAEEFARVVGELSEGRFQIQPFAAGEIVPGLQVLDAVGNGTVEAGQTPVYYYVGKDPTFAFGTALPFGLNARMQNSWLFQAGGIQLLNEFFEKFGVHGFPAGNTGCQMGGWFRKEIKTVTDLKGLKFRIAGLAGRIWQKVGAVPQQIAGGEIYPALEKGTIDAAEWVGPYDDEKLGFYKVAPYYYYPGWWEGGPTPYLIFNLAKWNELPKHYQDICYYAAAYCNIWMMAKYDMVNPPALRRLVSQGTQLRPFPREVMEAFYGAANELYAELSAESAAFKKLYDHLAAFRSEAYFWFQVAEFNFDAFQVRFRTKA